jgi:hypothetical protein
MFFTEAKGIPRSDWAKKVNHLPSVSVPTGHRITSCMETKYCGGGGTRVQHAFALIRPESLTVIAVYLKLIYPEA